MSSLPKVIEFIQPFQIENLNLRGRIVHLNKILNHLLNSHNYPYAVARLLAETVTGAAVLARTIKYEGLFTLQTSGNGPVTMMVVEISTDGMIRAYAQYKPEKLDKILAVATPEEVETSDIRTFLGSGYLAFTVDQATNNDRYQGIVQLTGKNIEAAIQAYFKESEQIDTALKIGVSRLESGDWHATGLMLQRLPEEEDHLISSDAVDSWRRAMIFMSTLTQEEMVNPDLSTVDILYRLFNEDGVRIYDPHPLYNGCRCSREKLENVLKNLPKEELEHLAEDGTITATCEFCKTDYVFSRSEIDQFQISQTPELTTNKKRDES